MMHDEEIVPLQALKLRHRAEDRAERRRDVFDKDLGAVAERAKVTPHQHQGVGDRITLEAPEWNW